MGWPPSAWRTIRSAQRTGEWPGCVSTLLFPEAVTPVCSPSFLAAASAPAGSWDELPLLHLESADDAPWLSWPDWFEANGIQTPVRGHDLTFNTYPLVLQAAIMGQGVALGWHPLVETLIAAGQLVAMVPEPTLTERGYFIRQAERKHPDPKCDRFRAWLVAEAANGSAPGPENLGPGAGDGAKAGSPAFTRGHAKLG
jgi:LysR family glycine cleavage system transcriptional activator